MLLIHLRPGTHFKFSRPNRIASNKDKFIVTTNIYEDAVDIVNLRTGRQILCPLGYSVKKI